MARDVKQTVSVGSGATGRRPDVLRWGAITLVVSLASGGATVAGHQLGRDRENPAHQQTIEQVHELQTAVAIDREKLEALRNLTDERWRSIDARLIEIRDELRRRR